MADRTLAEGQPPETEKEASPEASGQVFANRFEVMEVLGEGGMGRVYRVRDRQIEGREIALKILRPLYSRDARFRELFFREIRAAQEFVSEHVVQVRDTGQMEDGRLFLTMDLVDGQDLSRQLEREHSLHQRHALEITRQVLQGLGSGHEQGFVHRDIKPSNVMLLAKTPKTEDNPFGVHAKILDFGLANLTADLEQSEVQGTPSYMSPEQVQGQRLDARSDLFAVGVMLYEMVSGSRPFSGTTLHEVTQSVIETDVEPLVGELEHLSPAVQGLLKKALQKDREKRFQSAADFTAAIEGSKAYRLPTGVPVWLGALTLLLAGAAAAEGFVLYRQSEKLALRREENAQLVNRLQDAAQSALAASQKALAAQVEKADEQGRQYQSELADKDGLFEALQTKYDELQTEKTQEFAQREVGVSQIAELRRDYGAQQEELGELRTQVRNLRTENLKLNTRLDPVFRTAEGFDTIVAFIAEGLGEQARSRLEDLQDEGYLVSERANGGEFLQHLAVAAEALYLFEHPRQGGLGDSAHLQRVSSSLASARLAFEAFPHAAAEWLDFAFAGREAPDRIRAAESALTLLEEGLAARRQDLTGSHDAAATELLAAPIESGPEDAVRHQGRFGCEHLSDVTERFAGHLRDLQSDGDLDWTRLEGVRALDAWGEGIARGDVAADTAAAESILTFWFAKSWYGEEERVGDDGLWRSVLRPALALASEPRDDWRAALALRYTLVRHADEYDLPPTLGRSGRAIFRYLDLANGKVSWIVEELGSYDAPSGKWTYTRRRYPSDPLARVVSAELEIERRGSIFEYAGNVWLDLRDGREGVEVVGWSRTAPSEFPPSINVQKSELDRFAREVAESPAPCLVVEKAGKELWISPRFGLVREEHPGVSVKELAFSSARRPN